MKKIKLGLEKFEIAKLSNSYRIMGGYGDGGTEGGTNTEENGKPKKPKITTVIGD
jgi:hypothetical protein